MVKTRPVIVASRRLEGRRALVNVIPISMTPPDQPRRWHVKLPIGYMPHGWANKGGDQWAKCDMLTVVSLERLSLTVSAYRLRSHPAEARRLDEATMRRIRHALAYVFELF